MAFYTIFLIPLIAFILQVDAVSKESVGDKKINLALEDTKKSFGMLQDVYSQAGIIFNHYQSCGIGTHLEIFNSAIEKLNDIASCVNATRKIADYEEFLFHFYSYAKFVGVTVVELVKDVADCRYQHGLFSILNCTVTEIQSSGAEFDEILSRATSLIAEVDDDTLELIYYMKKCFTHSSKEFLTQTHSLIMKC